MLYAIGEDNTKVTEKLEQNLELAAKWGAKWLVRFNESKTVVMTFGSHRNELPIHFKDQTLTDSQHHKHLGVILESNLGWTEHVKTTVDKAAGSLRYLTIAQKLVTQEVLSSIYLTLVRPLLEYACSVWSNLTAAQASKLQDIQNRAARLATHSVSFASIASMHEELGWTPLDVRRKYFRLLFYKKLLSGMMPPYLTSQVALHNHQYNTRQTKAKTYTHRFAAFKNSLLPSAAREYNELNEDLRKTGTFATFKVNIIDGEALRKTCYIAVCAWATPPLSPTFSNAWVLLTQIVSTAKNPKLLNILH